MPTIPIPNDFQQWRQIARKLLAENVSPEQALWVDGPMLGGLPAQAFIENEDVGGSATTSTVPRQFISLAEQVAAHRDLRKWELLYRVLWRLTHGERRLLEIAVDPDVHDLLAMEKAVRHDVHKMKAFVRFRRVEDETGEHFVAWHRPDHLIVHLAAPFFARRFSVMRWTILTPDESVSWNGSELRFSAGVPRSAAPREDEVEEVWRTYYGAVFNPARIKLKAMRKEMPVRHWATLPETQMIDELLRSAPSRVATMIERGKSTQPVSAAEFVPASASLAVLAESARACRGCSLCQTATQTVFGEGPADARVMFVGEQPGDQEDLAGRPFVGPAGQVFNRALEEAGIDRQTVYVTNAVKHFKFEPRGTRRIHSKPSSREVAACQPWLKAEIESLHPQWIVCLGATAAQSLLGAAFRVTQNRGRIISDSAHAPQILATIHPSAILRTPDPALREQAYAGLVSDLRIVASELLER